MTNTSTNTNITHKRSLSYADCEIIQNHIKNKTITISNNLSSVEFERGQIYIADLGSGMGSEQSGVRPVLIVQNNKGNKFSPTITIIPITSAIKKEIPTHVNLPKFTGGLAKDSTLVVEQMRTIDKSRIGRFIGKLPETIMSTVNGKILIQMGI